MQLAKVGVGARRGTCQRLRQSESGATNAIGRMTMAGFVGGSILPRTPTPGGTRLAHPSVEFVWVDPLR